MGLLLMALLFSASSAEIDPAKEIEGLRVPSELYWAAYRASGAKLCDPTLRENQERQFDNRFGGRVSKLISVIRAKQSQGDNLIVTSDCLAFVDRDSATNALSRALDDFGPALDAMERRYGITNP
ncbi:MAG: hypothetical protein JF628_06550 [Sphingomonas sp.]|nr:hypothetical protein [Sphingomonas sp.]